MTRPATKKQPGSSKGATAKTAAGAAGQRFPPPLKPRRKLFVLLLLAFFAWVGLLVALYFKTVYPLRHPVGEPPVMGQPRSGESQ